MTIHARDELGTELGFTFHVRLDEGDDDASPDAGSDS
jgi:hypothetical protein